MKSLYATYQQTLDWNHGEVAWSDIRDEDIQEHLLFPMTLEYIENNGLVMLEPIVEHIRDIQAGARPVVAIEFDEDGEISEDLDGNTTEELLRAYQFLKFNNIPYRPYVNIVDSFNSYLGNKYEMIKYYSTFDLFQVRDRTNNLKYTANMSSETSLLHEYQIGLELNNYDLSYMVKTYNYTSEIGLECIILEDLPVQSDFLTTLRKYIHLNVLRENKIAVLKALSYMCMDMAIIGFTHWDFHPNNIIVNMSQSQIYRINDLNISSPVRITIVDFEDSYHPNVNGGKGFNPVADISKLVEHFHNYTDIKLPKAYSLLRSNTPDSMIKLGSIIQALSEDTQW